MSKPYNVPSWAGKPLDDFYFEIIKDGMIIGKIDLNKELFNEKTYKIIGRQPDIVDIAMDHPSLSRQHAVLQFRDDGALMLLDLKSAQGTYLNKQKISPDNYYRVYVGSMIRFGASSRLHILCGPDSHQQPEYDSTNMQIYREKLTNKSVDVKKKVEETNSMGISWGFSDDAPDNDSDNSDNENIPEYLKNDENYDRKYGKVYSSNIDEQEVSEKNPRLYEKLKKNERKIQNMQDENKKIYLKENNQENGLTEGQLNTVTRNDDRIQLLIQENEDILFQINGLSMKKVDTTKVVDKRHRDNDSDEDDLYDTTKQTMDINNNWRLKKKLSKTKPNNNVLNQSEGLTHDELIDERDRYINLLNNSIIRTNEIQSLLDELAQLPESDDNDDITNVINTSKENDLRNELKQLKQNEIDHNKNIQKFEKLINLTKTSLSYLNTKS